MRKLPEGHVERYDWSRSTRGRLAQQAALGRTNLRALDDELAEAFPDSASVNAALRALLAMREALMPPPPGRRRSKRAA